MNEKLKAEYARQIYKDTECWTTKEVYEYFAEVVYQNEQLKDRIDKAIEYIENCDPDNLNSMFLNESYISNYGACELLKILKGGENE